MAKKIRSSIAPEVLAHRVNRLLELINEFGTTKALADKFDLNASYISQLKTGHSNFGEKAVLAIEKKIERPGFFSAGSNKALSPGQADLMEAAKLAPELSDEMARTIAQLIRSSPKKTP